LDTPGKSAQGQEDDPAADWNVAGRSSPIRRVYKKPEDKDDPGLDFPGFGPHSLRRANITWRQEVGGSSIETSKIAGHASAAITEEYTLVGLQRQDELTWLIQTKRAKAARNAKTDAQPVTALLAGATPARAERACGEEGDGGREHEGCRGVRWTTGTPDANGNSRAVEEPQARTAIS